jgi:hypothetical protein
MYSFLNHLLVTKLSPAKKKKKDNEEDLQKKKKQETFSFPQNFTSKRQSRCLL